MLFSEHKKVPGFRRLIQITNDLKNIRHVTHLTKGEEGVEGLRPASQNETSRPKAKARSSFASLAKAVRLDIGHMNNTDKWNTLPGFISLSRGWNSNNY